MEFEKKEVFVKGVGMVEVETKNIDIDATLKAGTERAERLKNEDPNENDVCILDLFRDQELIETNDGSYKTECPCCGLQGDRTQGFIMWPEGNRAYCHSSMKNFSMLEAYAMKKGIIKCVDGRETGQKGKILDREQFKETLDALNDEFDDKLCSEIYEVCGLKKSIELPNNGKLVSIFANELGKKFNSENQLFLRNDTQQVVEIIKVKNIKGEVEYNGFSEVKPNRFITLIEKYFKPWEKKERNNGSFRFTTKSMSQSVGQTVLVSDNFIDKLPTINGIYSVPIPVYHNGNIKFPKRGYDDELKSWMPYDAPDIIEPEMSLERAKSIIGFLYKEFCLQSPQDYTHSVARLLTLFIRRLYREENIRPPFFILKANRERSGKDYHEGIASIVFEGVATESPPLSTEGKNGNNPDELRKMITSAYMAGREKIHFANNRGKINNPVLEQFITSPVWTDRILGKNKWAKWINVIHGSGSGNVGVTMTADLVNRTRTINLFLDVEDANSRDFETPNLHGWVKDNRGLILSALYSIVRNWFDKGRPDGSAPFTSFPEWARVCGGIMEAAGYDSPCMPEKDLLGLSVDDETADMKALFEECYNKYPETYINKNNIKEIISKDGDMFSDVDFEKSSDNIKFGLKLNKYVGRILSDIRLSVEDSKIRSARWKYKFDKEIAIFDKKTIIISDFDPKDGIDGIDGIELPPVPTIDTCEDGRDRGKNYTNYTNYTKPKSDRQIQFTEAEECKNITTKCEKDKIEEWIKSNPKKTTAELYEEFGVGSLKYKNELKAEGKI